jgi:hypothetical protein
VERVRKLAAALIIFAVAAGPGSSQAMTLADIDAFPSLDNTLFFSNWEVVPTGSLGNLDLSSILVVPTVNGFGFDLVGPLSANGGEIGDLVVRFDVDAVDVLDWARLSMTGAATGLGAGASVTETFQGVGDRQLFIYAIGEGPSSLDTGQVSLLDLQLLHLRVTKDIILDSTVLSGPPGSAQISVVTQEFKIIPEPTTGMLVLLGVGGGLLLRLRRI